MGTWHAHSDAYLNQQLFVAHIFLEIIMLSNNIAKIRGIRKQTQEETRRGVINKRSDQIKSSDSVELQKYRSYIQKYFCWLDDCYFIATYLSSKLSANHLSLHSVLQQKCLSIQSLFLLVFQRQQKQVYEILGRLTGLHFQVQKPGKFDSGVKAARLAVSKGKVWKNYEGSDRLCLQ